MYADATELVSLRRQLANPRRRGFAINDQRTELTAVGTAVRDCGGAPVAAVALAIPTVRFRRESLAGWVAAITSTARRIGDELINSSPIAARP